MLGYVACKKKETNSYIILHTFLGIKQTLHYKVAVE